MTTEIDLDLGIQLRKRKMFGLSGVLASIQVDALDMLIFPRVVNKFLIHMGSRLNI